MFTTTLQQWRATFQRPGWVGPSIKYALINALICGGIWALSAGIHAHNIAFSESIGVVLAAVAWLVPNVAMGGERLAKVDASRRLKTTVGILAGVGILMGAIAIHLTLVHLFSDASTTWTSRAMVASWACSVWGFTSIDLRLTLARDPERVSLFLGGYALIALLYVISGFEWV